MHDPQIRTDLPGQLVRVAQNSLRILAQTDGAQQFSVRYRPWGYFLGVFAGDHGTVNVVQYFGCRRANEHPPEGTGVSRHDDEIESVPRVQGDLRCHISGNENSRIPGDRKFGLEEGIESRARQCLMFLRNFVRSSYVKFQAIVTGRIEHMDY